MNKLDNLDMLEIKATIEKELVNQTRWIIDSQIVTVAIVMLIVKLARG
ncbi:hypothetical protein [Fructobacillus fructosus]|nr:hypothetical protein [Fructobacillus fructosus]MBC9119415.1 hypothetical protein [Fructobacillus fructosus]MBD9366930.1 hypothetical protein [Leuconostoc mesenteroides]